MFIKYNKNNLHALGTYDGKDIKFLRPGWNEFPSDIFKLYENDAEIKRMIEDKTIEVMAEKVVIQDGKRKITKIIGKDDEEVHVKELPEAKAIEVVKGTLNRDILQRWMDEETRHKVKRAIDAQLKPLLPDAKASGE